MAKTGKKAKTKAEKRRNKGTRREAKTVKAKTERSRRDEEHEAEERGEIKKPEKKGKRKRNSRSIDEIKAELLKKLTYLKKRVTLINRKFFRGSEVNIGVATKFLGNAIDAIPNLPDDWEPRRLNKKMPVAGERLMLKPNLPKDREATYRHMDATLSTFYGCIMDKPSYDGKNVIVRRPIILKDNTTFLVATLVHKRDITPYIEGIPPGGESEEEEVEESEEKTK